MKVLHVIPGVAARYGGPSRAVVEMCVALKERGVSTLIATTDADGTRRLPVELGKPISYQRVPTIFFSRQWSEAFKYSHSLSDWLDSNVHSFDVVHIHAIFSHACLAAARACRKHGIPYVIRPLGTLDPWSMSQKPLRKRFIWRIAGSRAVKNASAVHYTTLDEQYLAEQSLGINHGVVIPLGVEIDGLTSSAGSEIFRSRFPSLASNPYMLVLSRLHHKKNLELLIQVFLKVVTEPKFGNWRLVIAGSGDASYISSLERLAEMGGANGNIIFPGWLEGEEKKSILQNSAVLTLISHQENFGICVAEALACGVPVIVSRQVNLANDIERAGIGWVSELRVDQLLPLFAEVLSNEAERKQRGRLGHEFATRHFSWSESAAKLTKLYTAVTGQDSNVPV